MRTKMWKSPTHWFLVEATARENRGKNDTRKAKQCASWFSGKSPKKVTFAVTLHWHSGIIDPPNMPTWVAFNRGHYITNPNSELL